MGDGRGEGDTVNIRNIHDFETIITLVTPIVLARSPRPASESENRSSVTQTLRGLSAAFKAMAEGNKIYAIRMIRQLTGCGLKEAKDVVEGSYQG